MYIYALDHIHIVYGWSLSRVGRAQFESLDQSVLDKIVQIEGTELLPWHDRARLCMTV